MNKYLNKLGYILEKDTLDKSQITKIKKDLTVSPFIAPIFKDFQPNVETYPIYLETPKRLFVPRFYGIEHYGNPITNLLPEGKTINVTDNIKLLSHQLSAYNESIKQLTTIGGGVLTLPCGFGKTIIALKIIATLKVKTIVVVNKEFLMDQWIERIRQFIPEAKIGIIQQNRAEVEATDIVIAMIHSVSQKEYPKETFDDFALAVIDETHHASAKMFCKALPKIACKYQLGLSATPERKDGLSYVFYYYLGQMYHSEKRTGANNVLVKQIKINCDLPNYEVVYKTLRGKEYKNSQAMIGQICDFDIRNQLIMKIIERLISKGRKILLLSDRREHLEIFYDKLLPKASLRTAENKFATFGLYYGKSGGTSKKDHKKMLEATSKCDIVLGTCMMASEALDIPDLNTLILTTPMTDVEQASGRILRKFHKDLNPLIIDIVDCFGNFEKHCKMREKYFLSEDYVVQDIDIYLSKDQSENNAYFEKVSCFLDKTDINGIPKQTKLKKPKEKEVKDNKPIKIVKQTSKKSIYSKNLDKVIEIPVTPLLKERAKLDKNYPETNLGVCLLD